MKDEKQILYELLEAGEEYALALVNMWRQGALTTEALRDNARKKLIDAVDEVRKATK